MSNAGLTVGRIDFGPFNRFTVGLDDMFDDLAKMHGYTDSNYPPYNIIKYNEDNYAIEVAVAGFDQSEIDINVEMNIPDGDQSSIESSIKKNLNILKAINKVQKAKKPTVISCKTIIGYGSPNKNNTAGVHGSPLGSAEIDLVRKKLKWKYPPFEIPENILKEWRKLIITGKKHEENWKKDFDKLEKNKKEEFLKLEKKQPTLAPTPTPAPAPPPGATPPPPPRRAPAPAWRWR